MTLKQNDGTPIVFSEWSWVGGGRVKRRDYRLDVLMMENKDPSSYDSNNMQLSLFAEEVSGAENWMIDPLTGQSTPAPIAEYPLMHFTRLQEAENYGT